MLDQAESLDRKYRQHTRHEIQQKTARQGEHRGANKFERTGGIRQGRLDRGRPRTTTCSHSTSSSLRQGSRRYFAWSRLLRHRPTRAVEPRDDAAGDGVAQPRNDDRDRPRLPLEDSGRRGRVCHDDVGLQAEKLLRERSYPIDFGVV
jgi:hypothetical protein